MFSPERDWLKCAEEHERNLAMGTLVFHLSSRAQAARKQQLCSSKPNIITASHVKIRQRIKLVQGLQAERIWSNQTQSILQQ
jgi:hypothetical protein